MTTITSQVHPETISGWSPIGPLVSGMGSSLAFTILTGLAERLVFPPSSAFRTGYGPRCLSAQGQSRDLQHLSPMLARCGNSALRDMAHMGSAQSSPTYHIFVLPFLVKLLGGSGPSIVGARSNDPLIVDIAQESCQGKHDLPYRSSRVENKAFPPQCLASKDFPC